MRVWHILSRHSTGHLQHVADVGSEKGHCVIHEWPFDEAQRSNLDGARFSQPNEVAKPVRDPHDGDLVEERVSGHPKAERRKTNAPATYMTHCG